jgi:hypothetical protein
VNRPRREFMVVAVMPTMLNVPSQRRGRLGVGQYEVGRTGSAPQHPNDERGAISAWANDGERVEVRYHTGMDAIEHVERGPGAVVTLIVGEIILFVALVTILLLIGEILVAYARFFGVG